MIDPRQVRARVLALSADPAAAEVTLQPTPDVPDSVLVRVPAMSAAVDRDLASRLDALADLGDDELVRRLRGDGPIGASLRALTSGAAGLLVAEVVALMAGPTA